MRFNNYYVQAVYFSVLLEGKLNEGLHVKMNETTSVWQEKLQQCLVGYDYVVKPRGMEVREVLNGRYIVPMPAYLNLKNRKVNHGLMLAEATWILAGFNQLSYLTQHVKGYANFSDDGIFLKGAYGPKVVDQLPYVVDVIASDVDTRQAVLTIWRERPGPSKDVPCTVAMQFLVRNDDLHVVVTMRSQDVVLGFTYDVFTFSMIAKAVQLLLRQRGVHVGLGDLHVNAGSLHLYDNYYDKANAWINDDETNPNAKIIVDSALDGVTTYSNLVGGLNVGAAACLR